MATRPHLLTILLLLIAAPATAQQFKREVDGMIRFFRGTAHANKSLGDGSCRLTAKVLTAMGHGHRLYSLADGPVVRNPLNFLITCRRADGSFADASCRCLVAPIFQIQARRITGGSRLVAVGAIDVQIGARSRVQGSCRRVIPDWHGWCFVGYACQIADRLPVG